MFTSAFSFVKSNHTPLSSFSWLFLDAHCVLLIQFIMGFLFLLHTCHRCMQSESRTCVVCSAVPVVITPNSRNRMTAIVITSLLFGLASSCFREESFNIKVTGNVYTLHLFLSSVVFSSFAIWGGRFLYLFSCRMSCCSGNVLFEPYPWTPLIP